MGTLNEYQQRYVLSILSQVSQHLDNVEDLIATDPNSNSQDNDSQEHALFLESLHSLRREMDAIRAGMQIKTTREAGSPQWQIVTNLEFASVELQELTHSKLAGYGELDSQAFEDLKHRLDAIQETLTHQLQRLRRSRK